MAPEESHAGDWARVQRLRLVAEVLSPSTARFDRFQKRTLYQRQGIEAIWLIDCDARSVEIWEPRAIAPVIAQRELYWHPQSASAPLIIPIESLFA